jgi:hypothetical protein
MARAKHPKPYQIAVGLSRQGWSATADWDVIGKRVVSRLYDRSSGNFKAVGWIVEVTYRKVDDWGNDMGLGLRTARVPLMDEFIPNYVQSSL